MTEPAREGSLHRRNARARLMDNARKAYKLGASFQMWMDNEDQVLLDTVSQRDLDSIFYLVWKAR